MMNNEESGLNTLFRSYRAACPEVEAGPLFMPSLWQKIEGRRGFWSVFQGLARTAMAASAALALLLLALNFVVPDQGAFLSPSYTDALVADHSVEKTYYAETVRRPAPADSIDSERIQP